MQGDPGDGKDGKRKDTGYGLYRRGNTDDIVCRAIGSSAFMHRTKFFDGDGTGIYGGSGTTGQHHKRETESDPEISGDTDFDQSADDAAEDA